MAISIAYLLLLPATVYAKITIEVVLSPNSNERQVLFSGENNNIITIAEESAVIKTEAVINNLERRLGKRVKPCVIYGKNPSMTKDFHAIVDKKPVTRYLKPTNAKILSITQEPRYLTRRQIVNTDDTNQSVDFKVNTKVYDRLKSEWKKTAKVPHNYLQDTYIDYIFHVKVLSGKHNETIEHRAKWDDNQEIDIAFKIESDKPLILPHRPKDTVYADVSGIGGIVKIQVDYEYGLTGDIMVFCKKQFSNPAYSNLEWIDVSDALTEYRAENASEIIELTYYSGAEFQLKRPNLDSIENIIGYEEDIRKF